MNLTPLAKGWLQYARTIFVCRAHQHTCDAPNIKGIDQSLRWPGFIGLDYENAPKRMLFLGRVHNPSGWHPSGGLAELERLAHKWIQGSLSDQKFFFEYNSEYARQLKTWGPWKKVYSHLAAAAQIDESGVAYANVAKCWQFPGMESEAQRKCSETFAVQALVDLTKPRGVFLLAPDDWLKKVPTAKVSGTAFMNDSARHFNIPKSRMAAAIAWVQSL